MIKSRKVTWVRYMGGTEEVRSKHKHLVEKIRDVLDTDGKIILKFILRKYSETMRTTFTWHWSGKAGVLLSLTRLYC